MPDLGRCASLCTLPYGLPPPKALVFLCITGTGVGQMLFANRKVSDAAAVASKALAGRLTQEDGQERHDLERELQLVLVQFAETILRQSDLRSTRAITRRLKAPADPARRR